MYVKVSKWWFMVHDWVQPREIGGIVSKSTVILIYQQFADNIYIEVGSWNSTSSEVDRPRKETDSSSTTVIPISSTVHPMSTTALSGDHNA